MKAVFTRKDYSYRPLDSLPFPDYEPFGIRDMMDNYSMATRLLYRYPRTEPRPFNIAASRGCAFSCTFCVDHHRQYRARSVENVMQEIKDSYERYRFNILIMLDELFAVKKERLSEFSLAIIEGKEKYGWSFDWMFQTHASARFDLHTLKLAKKAGCFLFSYGLESASPKVIASMNKHLKLADVIEAAYLAKSAGIGFSANLIFGDPAETLETIAESLSFWLKYGQTTMMFLAELKPYPGSHVFEQCIEKGIIKDKAKFYEAIDDSPINMTGIRDDVLHDTMFVLGNLERLWLFAKPCLDVKVKEIEGRNPMLSFSGQKIHEITAKCPYCNGDLVFHEMLGEIAKGAFLGTACYKCGQRIKIHLN